MPVESTGGFLRRPETLFLQSFDVPSGLSRLERSTRGLADKDVALRSAKGPEDV